MYFYYERKIGINCVTLTNFHRVYSVPNVHSLDESVLTSTVRSTFMFSLFFSRSFSLDNRSVDNRKFTDTINFRWEKSHLRGVSEFHWFLVYFVKFKPRVVAFFHQNAAKFKWRSNSIGSKDFKMTSKKLSST